MSTYEIVRHARGKSRIVAVGSRQKMRDRLQELRKSTPGGVSGRRKKYPVTFELRKAKTADELLDDQLFDTLGSLDGGVDALEAYLDREGI